MPSNSAIPEGLVKKLDLRLSKKTIGNSFIYDAKIYEYPLIDNCYLMECDILGNRLKKDTFFILIPGKLSSYITYELLNDLSPKLLNDLLIDLIHSNGRKVNGYF